MTLIKWSVNIYKISYQTNTSSLFILSDWLKEATCAEQIKSEKLKEHETVKKDLPTYSREEIMKHSDPLVSKLHNRVNCLMQ